MVKYSKLAHILRKFLFERGMKPADLARAVNLPPPTIHRIITGKSSKPYKSSLEPIANFFSVSVEELTGIMEAEHKDVNLCKNKGREIKIPLICWYLIENYLIPPLSEVKDSLMISQGSSRSFATIMPDSSMEPLFPKNCILILDPAIKPLDRSYVLVKLSNGSLTFRQILIDADYKYLKPLNPELSTLKLRILEKEDTILSCLTESRTSYREERIELAL
ncbi:MAG: S24 family peptidase [Gammaproteobacteria bacterium]